MVRKGVRDYISNLKIFVSHHEVPNNEMKITIMNYTKKMKLFLSIPGSLTYYFWILEQNRISHAFSQCLYEIFSKQPVHVTIMIRT